MHSYAAPGQSSESCHQNIREAVCLVDPPHEEKNRYKDGRICLSGGQRYYQQIIEAYDTFPEFAQKIVCSLRKIYIEKDFFGPAWSALDDDNNPNSGLIGLRKKDLDTHLGVEDYNSWFEQQSFGGSQDYNISTRLPMTIVLPENKKSLGFLSYTFLHEIGHILDYQQHFNQVDCSSISGFCKSRPGSWTALSWMYIESPKAENDFAQRKDICLNACHGEYLSMTDADNFYKTLHENGFISQLSALNAREDWAEAFAIYVSTKYMDIHYKIVLPTGVEYKLDDVLNSNVFLAKNRYLEKVVRSLETMY